MPPTIRQKTLSASWLLWRGTTEEFERRYRTDAVEMHKALTSCCAVCDTDLPTRA